MNTQNEHHEQSDVEAITDTFAELIDWILEQVGSAKELAQHQMEKFKRKIQRFKKLNGSAHSRLMNE